MTTLYHAPLSRSSTIMTLIDELDADIDIVEVTIPREDGTGGPDPRNPHPEKKVPYMTDGTETFRERGAIILHLTDSFPEAGLGPRHGDKGRGAYLSWLFYYQGVLEPVMILDWAKFSHPAVHAGLRDLDTALNYLSDTLQDRPYLLGENYSAADLLCCSPFLWFPGMLDKHPTVQAWVDRCAARPAAIRTFERENPKA